MVIFALLSFLVTALSAPAWMRHARARGYLGVDVHKEEKPTIPEMGGIVIFAGYAAGLLATYFYVHDVRILLSLCATSVMFAIGVIDDRRNITQKQKFAASFLAGIPLLLGIHYTTIDFIFFSIDFGLMYYLLVFAGIVAASNATNLLAGFNGEEAGCGVISTLSLFCASLVLGLDISSLLLLPMTASLLAFLHFNRYPSRLFCGDCGSLIIGASIASAVIFGKMEVLGALALAPAIAEFFLKLRIRFSGKSMGATRVVEGILHPPPYLSVANALTSRFTLTEPRLVLFIWAIQGFFGLVVFLLSCV